MQIFLRPRKYVQRKYATKDVIKKYVAFQLHAMLSRTLDRGDVYTSTDIQFTILDDYAI